MFDAYETLQRWISEKTLADPDVYAIRCNLYNSANGIRCYVYSSIEYMAPTGPKDHYVNMNLKWDIFNPMKLFMPSVMSLNRRTNTVRGKYNKPNFSTVESYYKFTLVSKEVANKEISLINKNSIDLSLARDFFAILVDEVCEDPLNLTDRSSCVIQYLLKSRVEWHNQDNQNSSEKRS